MTKPETGKVGQAGKSDGPPLGELIEQIAEKLTPGELDALGDFAQRTVTLRKNFEEQGTALVATQAQLRKMEAGMGTVGNMLAALVKRTDAGSLRIQRSEVESNEDDGPQLRVNCVVDQATGEYVLTLGMPNQPPSLQIVKDPQN